jgi:hypothetical protein
VGTPSGLALAQRNPLRCQQSYFTVAPGWPADWATAVPQSIRTPPYRTLRQAGAGCLRNLWALTIATDKQAKAPRRRSLLAGRSNSVQVAKPVPKYVLTGISDFNSVSPQNHWRGALTR